MKRSLLATSFVLAASFGFGQLQVSARSAIIVDADSGKVLWEKDADSPRYPASTTKIMTSLLLIEQCLPEEVIVAPKGVDKVEPSSMHLVPGERVKAREMLYALMLRSANDGCVAVAHHLGGSVQGFAKLMNDRAKQLGCTATTFYNPHGLPHEKHRSTARDLAIIARAAMRYEAFEQAASTAKQKIQRSTNGKDLLMVSHNKLLPKDATVDGIKTGYTRAAGKCFVGSATRDGYRVITVVLKSEDWQKDTSKMLDWAFKYHARVPERAQGDLLREVELPGSNAPVEALLGEDLFHIYPTKFAKPPVQYDIDLIDNLEEVQQGDPIGKAIFYDETGWRKEVPLLAGSTVERRVVAASVGSPLGFGILGGSLCFGAFLMRAKARRLRDYGKTPARQFIQ